MVGGSPCSRALRAGRIGSTFLPASPTLVRLTRTVRACSPARCVSAASSILAPTPTAPPTGAAVNSPPTGSLAVAFFLRRRVRLRLYPRRSTCHYPCADAHGSAYAHSGQRAARRIARGNRCRAHAATRVTPGAGVAGGVPVADIAVPARER